MLMLLAYHICFSYLMFTVTFYAFITGFQWGECTRNGEVQCFQAHLEQQDFPVHPWLHHSIPGHYGTVSGEVCQHSSIKQGAMVDHSVHWIHELAYSCNC